MASRIARPTIYNINKPSKRRTDEPLICNRRKTPFVLGQKVRIPSLSLTGIVRYIGETKFKPNEIWIGIELDVKGTGKNDGCIQGVRYFTCPPQTGLFVSAHKVEEAMKPRKSLSTKPITRQKAPPMVRSKTSDDTQQAQEEEQKDKQLKRALAAAHTQSEQYKEAALVARQYTDTLKERIDRLERERVQERKEHEREMQQSAAQMDQLRAQLSDRDRTFATVEREYAELRTAHIETMQSYQQLVIRMKQEHTEAIHQKDLQMRELEKKMERWEEEREEAENEPACRRLQAQLELTTQALDREREQVQAMVAEISRLKGDVKRVHRLSTSSTLECHRLQSLLDQEIQDKRRMMDEVNAAVETQVRLEEENEQMRINLDKSQCDLANALKRLVALEKQKIGSDDGLVEQLRQENNAWIKSYQRAEQECLRWMNEGLEKCSHEWFLEQLRREEERHQQAQYAFQQTIERLTKELCNVESLVEIKVLRETELEERLEQEKRKVMALEDRARHTTIPTPTSPVCQLKDLNVNPYCEICEEYGHDLMQCTALSDLSISKPNYLYCVNCDVFNEHSTGACPNQDETF
ncbi:hypothetical protein CU097_003638 [Rhizopus azygosporus]|uniref:CAP-Gly domain-containing protein n=1 Tax=Rhizopus azygosporus TaxID=86630 RepID=A0A367JBD2_RHIAZ|nr:hypothetical protein CU097_003638 [Rhizopus azygosporus]